MSLLLGLIGLLTMLSGAAAAVPGKVVAGPWVELGTDNNLSVRVVVPSGVPACPEVVADGKTIQARQRGAADGNFPVTVCTAVVPLATANLSVNGKPVPVAPKTINRIVIIGDTGCRIEGKAAQDCGDTKQWPFPVIATDAAGRKPDLVIHVGDYYYREDACPAGNSGCSGSPHGDNWNAWRADFFDPAEPLLVAAPWVMVRGNHEVCRRGGLGWQRLLDPRPALTECADTSPPYRLQLGGLDLLLFDDSAADDFKPDPGKVAAYARQFAPLLKDAPPHSWLLLHRPVWALAQGKLGDKNLNQTMEAAIRGQVPPGLDMVVSGHLHDFTSYAFGSRRPSQLIVGVGGDTMLDLANVPLVGATIDGMKTTKGFALQRFGFFVLDRAEDGWKGALYAPGNETALARCTITGRDLDCH